MHSSLLVGQYPCCVYPIATVDSWIYSLSMSSDVRSFPDFLGLRRLAVD
jgi:hypothetical protein